MENDDEGIGEDIEASLEYTVEMIVTVTCCRPILASVSEMTDDANEITEKNEGDEQEPIDGRQRPHCSDGRQRPHSLVVCSRYTLFGIVFG